MGSWYANSRLARLTYNPGREGERVSKRGAWNARYSAAELVWGADPNRFLAAELGDAAPEGRALDLACGEGRNAIWLAARGWQVTAVDYSDVAIERARGLAAREGVDVEWVCADVTRWTPEAQAYRLVVILYLHVPGDERRRVFERAASALAPGGSLLVIGHARRNLAEGAGGPQDPDLLLEPEEVAAELGALGLRVERAEHLQRPFETEEGEVEAIDALLRAS
jgi:2-polyprenyl-3-methyl-5-hydroxy-6-metoxy-1,4-benzoquinol methylase